MMQRYGDILSFSLLATFLCWAIMAYAAWRDARTRTFPNGLAVAFTVACAIATVLSGGLTQLGVSDGAGGIQESGFWAPWGLAVLGRNALAATVVFAVLLAFELLWRSFRKESGLGIGDLKFLFALMLLEPVKALISFTLGLIALAITGSITRKSSLPLLPFIVGSYFVLLLVSFLLPFAM